MDQFLHRWGGNIAVSPPGTFAPLRAPRKRTSFNEARQSLRRRYAVNGFVAAPVEASAEAEAFIVLRNPSAALTLAMPGCLARAMRGASVSQLIAGSRSCRIC